MNRSTRGAGTAIRSKTGPGRNFEKPKTLSYTQLKDENGILHKHNAELECKFSKQSNALNASQRSAKTLEKENRTLREQLDEEQQRHAEHIESLMREWTSQRGMLTNKLTRCEMKLEDLGINPVILSNWNSAEENDRSKQEALAKAEVLKERLAENISNSQKFLHKIKEVTSQSRDALKQLDAEEPSF